MKFLPLLSAVLLSLALVSADSPAAVGAEKGKVPQLLELINKFEHANPSSPVFLAEYASEIPTLAKLHREVVAQAGEKQVRRLYGDNEAAKKLLQIVEGVKTEEKREVKDKKDKKVKENKGTKGKSEAAHKKAEEEKKAANAKKEKNVHPVHPSTHGDSVNHHKQGAKQSAAHKPAHAAHPEHPKNVTTSTTTEEEISKRATDSNPKKVHPAHPVHPSTHGDTVNHHKQGAKQSAAHKSTHATTHKKESKKPAHKHTSKKGVKASST